MSSRKRGGEGAGTDGVPEFSLVVKHPGRRGPLGPYRLVACVVVVAMVLGSSLLSSITGGAPDDIILLRAGAIGLLVWVTTGIVDSALAAASRPAPVELSVDDS